MININSYTQGAGVSMLREPSKPGEKLLSSEKTVAKKIATISNSTTEKKHPLIPYLSPPSINPEVQGTVYHPANGRDLHNATSVDSRLTDNQTIKKMQNAGVISKIQKRKNLLQKAVERFTTCDTKAQELLKFIQKDDSLWKDVHNKLEVRVIKAKEGEEIILHPKDEKKERWFGKYHIYVTIQDEDKRLVIDPYIGGDKSCAHLDEHDFIEFNWSGRQGKEYVLETVAPVDESFHNDVYTPPFSVKDYMYNLFDPDTFESHKF